MKRRIGTYRYSTLRSLGLVQNKRLGSPSKQTYICRAQGHSSVPTCFNINRTEINTALGRRKRGGEDGGGNKGGNGGETSRIMLGELTKNENENDSGPYG